MKKALIVSLLLAVGYVHAAPIGFTTLSNGKKTICFFKDRHNKKLKEFDDQIKKRVEEISSAYKKKVLENSASAYLELSFFTPILYKDANYMEEFGYRCRGSKSAIASDTIRDIFPNLKELFTKASGLEYAVPIDTDPLLEEVAHLSEWLYTPSVNQVDEKIALLQSGLDSNSYDYLQELWADCKISISDWIENDFSKKLVPECIDYKAIKKDRLLELTQLSVGWKGFVEDLCDLEFLLNILLDDQPNQVVIAGAQHCERVATHLQNMNLGFKLEKEIVLPVCRPEPELEKQSKLVPRKGLGITSRASSFAQEHKLLLIGLGIIGSGYLYLYPQRPLRACKQLAKWLEIKLWRGQSVGI